MTEADEKTAREKACQEEIHEVLRRHDCIIEPILTMRPDKSPSFTLVITAHTPSQGT